MTRSYDPIRRGLSLLELMLSLAVTALIAGAVSGMMTAVTMGVSSRRDNRTSMVGAYAASARLGAYVGPSLCALGQGKESLVLWLHDDRQSDSVHATEIRWFAFNEAAGTIEVSFVRFPDSWTKAAQDLEDIEYARDADWEAILATYNSKTWISKLAIVDNLNDINIKTDDADVLDVRQITFDLTFETSNGTAAIAVPTAIRLHAPPAF